MAVGRVEACLGLAVGVKGRWETRGARSGRGGRDTNPSRTDRPHHEHIRQQNERARQGRGARAHTPKCLTLCVSAYVVTYKSADYDDYQFYDVVKIHVISAPPIAVSLHRIP